MKRVIVCLAVVLVVFAAMLPGPAFAGGCCWWPGAVVGGIVYGAVALATLPLWALSTAFVPPPGPYPPPNYYAPPAYSAPYYGAPPTYYGTPPAYSAPVYSTPPAYYAPPTNSLPVQSAATASSQRTVTYAPSPAPPVQREVVFPNGRYLLFGDGVTQPWQWAWEPAGASALPSSATASATR